MIRVESDTIGEIGLEIIQQIVNKWEKDEMGKLAILYYIAEE